MSHPIQDAVRIQSEDFSPDEEVRAVRASSVRIQRLIVSEAVSGTNFGSEATPFISAKRVAFHSLVPKLR